MGKPWADGAVTPGNYKWGTANFCYSLGQGAKFLRARPLRRAKPHHCHFSHPRPNCYPSPRAAASEPRADGAVPLGDDERGREACALLLFAALQPGRAGRPAHREHLHPRLPHGQLPGACMDVLPHHASFTSPMGQPTNDTAVIDKMRMAGRSFSFSPSTDFLPSIMLPRLRARSTCCRTGVRNACHAILF